MKKVILLYIPNLGVGGAERVFANLANEMSKRDEYSVHLMSHYSGDNSSLIEDSVHRIDMNKMSWWFIYKTIRRLEPDAVLTTIDGANIRTAILKKLGAFSPKTIWIARAAAVYREAFYNTLRMKLSLKLVGIAYKVADSVIANSYDTAASLTKMCGVPPAKIITIGNPVFHENENNGMEEKQLFEKPYVMAVGRFSYTKRYDLLIEIFAKVRERMDVDLLIFGDGDLRSDIEKRIKDKCLEDAVHLMGVNLNLASYYKNAKCLLLSSQSEGFGNVIVESMAQGTPVVSFDVPGGPNFILEKGKYGPLVAFGDIETYTDTVVKLIKGDIVYEPEVLRHRAMAFSIERITDNYLKEINELYNQKK